MTKIYYHIESVIQSDLNLANEHGASDSLIGPNPTKQIGITPEAPVLNVLVAKAHLK